ncbi:hypothetical protein Taro_027569 [Colocasia esculenta]|uniref:Uncharacterized protein n=1 Tax=Colocasia esculenta TaxID=4460 RepID=A0A843V925_COLES|nr:hypothetical protein [Colocasia esculenta]
MKKRNLLHLSSEIETPQPRELKRSKGGTAGGAEEDGVRRAGTGEDAVHPGATNQALRSLRRGCLLLPFSPGVSYISDIVKLEEIANHDSIRHAKP